MHLRPTRTCIDAHFLFRWVHQFDAFGLARFAWCIYFWFRAAAIFAANLLWSFWLVSRMMAPSRWPLWLIATSYDCPHEGGFPLSHPCISYRICARSYPWDLSCQTITLWWFLLPMNLPPNPEPLSKFVFSSNMNMNVGLCTPDIGIGLVCLEFPASAAPYLLRGTLIVSLVASVHNAKSSPPRLHFSAFFMALSKSSYWFQPRGNFIIIWLRHQSSMPRVSVLTAFSALSSWTWS